MNTLGERMKHLRKQKGLTLAYIAELMGVTEATVQRWESGNIKSLRHGRAVQLADILGCTPAYLMGWEEVQKNNDALSDIIIRAQRNDMFLEVMKSLHRIPDDKLPMAKAVIDALNQ